METELGYKAAGRLRFTEQPPAFHHDARIIREHGHYFMTVPHAMDHASILSENQRIGEGRRPVVSIDPGSRTFLTCYDPLGNVMEIGIRNKCLEDKSKHGADQYKKHVDSKHYRIKELKALQKTAGHARRYRLQRAIDRLHARMKNMVKDIHCRAEL